MTEQRLRISGMSCAACQHHVERALRSVQGVERAQVDLMNHSAAVAAPDGLAASVLVKAVRAAGYDALPESFGAHTTADNSPAGESAAPRGALLGERTLGLRALSALVGGAAAMLLSMPLMMAGAQASARQSPAAADPMLAFVSRWMNPLMPGVVMRWTLQPLRWTLCGLTLLIMVCAAPDVYRAAWKAARHFTSNMNTLVALGTCAAFGSSLLATAAPAFSRAHGLGTDVYYEAVDLILGFLLAGRWLEARARRRATESVRNFARLQPAEARLLTEQPGMEFSTAQETLLPLDAVMVGDLLRVLPGERVAVDGLIVYGRSSIDESLLTGEPLPRTHGVGDRVAAGTLNLDGALVLRASAVGAESTLAQMERLLRDAQSRRAPMQRLADQASAVFVPAVLLIACATFAIWLIVLHTHGAAQATGRALQAAISVLVVACPCAMGLAVPAAVTVAVGSAARAGLLIKGGEVLERLAAVDTMALDKTGTLTEGKPTIAALVLRPETSFSREQLLGWAAAVERLSTHPLATAVVEYAAALSPAPEPLAVDDLQVLPGTGVRATVEGHQLAIGSDALLEGDPRPLLETLRPDVGLPAATPLYLQVDGRVEAALFATDTVRPSAQAALRALKRQGVQTVMLTGDIAAAANPMAEALGIADVRARLLPSAKVGAVAELQRQGHRVAMAGDGINDAAALAQADAGLAMAAGTDLARDAGDILLLHSDLMLLPFAVASSRRAVRVMRQNLGWAVGYNVLGIPIAAGALYPHFGLLLSPVLASAAMALSSVSVLLNSLRLRRLPRLPA